MRLSRKEFKRLSRKELKIELKETFIRLCQVTNKDNWVLKYDEEENGYIVCQINKDSWDSYPLGGQVMKSTDMLNSLIMVCNALEP